MGLQSVRVKTKRGYVMLAADAVHLFPHLDEGRVCPTTYNLAEVLEGYETLKKLASSRNHIVPGHDPAVMRIYPAASDGIEGAGHPAGCRSEGGRWRRRGRISGVIAPEQAGRKSYGRSDLALSERGSMCYASPNSAIAFK